jgi:hypothetical protein
VAGEESQEQLFVSGVATTAFRRPSASWRRYWRPNQGLPQADRQGAAGPGPGRRLSWTEQQMSEGLERPWVQLGEDFFL